MKYVYKCSGIKGGPSDVTSFAIFYQEPKDNDRWDEWVYRPYKNRNKHCGWVYRKRVDQTAPEETTDFYSIVFTWKKVERVSEKYILAYII